MNGYDIYVFVLCLIVFALLCGFAVFALRILVKQEKKLIRLGDQDDAIKREYDCPAQKKKFSIVIEKVFSWAFTVLFISVFAISLYFNFSQNAYYEDFPNVKIVKTASMAKKNEKNTYLFDNNLNDQIATFDLIFTYKLPKCEDLKLYDIVVYEVDEDILLVHRIVEIEEPNATHPNERWFVCQGDAVDKPDRFPVKYEQMRGIYRGKAIPYLGSFVMFMQSPAGYLCVLMVLGFAIATPIIEKRIAKEKDLRRISLGLSGATKVTKEELTLTVEETAVTEEELTLTVDETAVTTAGDEVSEVSATLSFGDLFSNKTSLSFDQKLEKASDKTKIWYADITELLGRIEGARLIKSKRQRSYKKGNTPIVKFLIKGKTVNAYLALNPVEYEQSKYIFTDETAIKSHKNYPMRVKLTSDRQVKWLKELLLDIVNKNGFTLLERSVKKTAWYEGLVKKKIRSFDQKLKAVKPLIKNNFSLLEKYLSDTAGVRLIKSKRQRSYKKGNTPIVKFLIKGKTINAYLALNPVEYEQSKYIFTDASSVKAHKGYPMRIKLTSDRQFRWVKELIDKLLGGESNED